MTALPGAPDLLGGLDLLVDGPVRWGQPVRSGRPGVYLIELPAPSAFAPLDIERLRRWLDRVPSLRLHGARPTPAELADRIRRYWVPDAPVLFVGSSERSVGGRVAAMYATPLGDARPYAGAHWLGTLQSPESLRVWWAETEAPQEHEDALLDAFAAAVPADVAAGLPEPDLVLPFAVLRRPTGERRRHGIADALLAAVPRAAPPTPSPSTSPSTSAAAPRSRPARARQPASGVPRSRAGTRAASPRASRDASGGAAPAPVQLSADGLAALEAELRELRDVRRPATVKRVAAARELGDLRENAEYQTSRQELGFIDGRIQLLEGRLRNAVVVEASWTPTAALGSTVVVDTGDGMLEYRLVDSSEANLAHGRLSTSSPVGRALLGRSPGDEVAVATPGGTRTMRIVEVR